MSTNISVTPEEIALIDTAFDLAISHLPAGAQANIRDAKTRDESVSYQLFKAGWIAHGDFIWGVTHEG